MIKLDFIDNPFTDDYLYSFNIFSDEKLFYDCIRRKKISNYDVFENLGSSFYTFMIVGDNNDWLGYVLFYNNDFLQSYLKYYYFELKLLLERIKFFTFDSNILNIVYDFIDDLLKIKSIDTTYLSKFNERIDFLKNACVGNDDILSLFCDFSNNISDYIKEFKEYYYLDIAIGLPLDTKEKQIENLYYGFIREVYCEVEKLINDYFKDIPIILSNNSYQFLFNNEKVKNLL